MLDRATCLRYYKRQDIQEAIVANARGRELAVKYDKGFGKRPDIISYPAEVLEFVKKGVTSFHVSEERWSNPLELSTSMPKKAMDELRVGWDIIIDIDSKEWEISKTATWLIVKLLKELGISSVSIKFSGNKGFHIGLPFEIFPETINGTETRSLFPDYPKAIAEFLIEEINKRYIKVEGNDLLFGDEKRFSLAELKKLTDDSILLRCGDCKEPIKKEEGYKNEFVCPVCGSSVTTEEDYVICDKCKKMMERVKYDRKASACKCGGEHIELNPYAVIDIDTLLISSRHMYRCSYSLHEKSGLASVPLDADEILDFDKRRAEPDNVKAEKHFLTHSGNNGAGELFSKVSLFRENRIKDNVKEEYNKEPQFEEFSEAAPESLFPPCINKLLEGMDDGKKRALFILYNFLKSVGWNHEEIEQKVREWNENNAEPLKENMLISHLRYHKARKILPPNCSNVMYYKDLHLCNPDNLCKKIKNPVNYTRRRSFFNKRQKKGQEPVSG